MERASTSAVEAEKSEAAIEPGAASIQEQVSTGVGCLLSYEWK